MSKALSLDLRIRVLEAVAEGLSQCAAAAGLGAGASSVRRRRSRARVDGEPRPRALDGGRRSGGIGAHRALILGVPAEISDVAREKLARLLAGAGSTLAMTRSSASLSTTG